MDARDISELAHHSIAKLVAEGWAPKDIDTHIKHEKTHKNGTPLPVEITLTVRFVPAP